MIHDTNKQLTIGRTPWERVVKFLKDYCYALYLGAFGAYLFGFVGLFLFGAWGVWKYKKISLRKKTEKVQKISFRGSYRLYKIFNKIEDWKPVYRYLIWGVMSIVLMQFYTYFIVIYEIATIATGLFGKNNTSWLLIAHDFTLKMSNLVPFIHHVTHQYTVHIYGLKNITQFIANTLSFSWFICIVRYPGLMRYLNETSVFFYKHIQRIELKIICFILFVSLFIFTFYQSFIGGMWLLSEGVGIRKGNLILINIFIVSTLVMFCLSIASFKNLTKNKLSQ